MSLKESTTHGAVQPPGPRGTPFLGSILDFRRDPLAFLTRLARDYGEIVRFKLGSQELFLVNQPDLIKDVLVTNADLFHKSRGLELAKRLLGDGLLTSEGVFHRYQRRLVQPAFHRLRIASYAVVMADYSARLATRWEDGVTVDIFKEMTQLTLAIVGKTLFDADVEGEAKEIGQALTDMFQLFTRITLPFAEFLDKLPLPSNFRFRKARARLDATIYRIINEHRATGQDRGDLLSMLLLTHEEGEGDALRMSNTQIRDEAMTLFLAGHETTAVALTWTWYLLARHPEVEARLVAELEQILEGRPPTADDFPLLQYTKMVFTEAMRLYPPAWMLGRRAMSDYKLDGFEAHAGSIILMSPFVMHRDPRYFPEPEKFDPERWLPNSRMNRPQFSYFPFGGGPRACLGEGFAWMEGVLVIATLVQRWHMHLVSERPVAPRPLITLRPRSGIAMKLEKRPALHN